MNFQEKIHTVGTRDASAKPQSPVLWPDSSMTTEPTLSPVLGMPLPAGRGHLSRVGAACAVCPCSNPSQTSARGSLICCLTPHCYLQLLKAPIEPCL